MKYLEFSGGFSATMGFVAAALYNIYFIFISLHHHETRAKKKCRSLLETWHQKEQRLIYYLSPATSNHSL